MAASLPLCLLSGAVGGLIAAPAFCGMLDTILRALRDEPGYWWHTYKRAMETKLEAESAARCAAGLFVGSWSWMLRAQAAAGNTSTMMWVASLAGIFVCTGFFSWLLAQAKSQCRRPG